jgi:hypothetical protein
MLPLPFTFFAGGIDAPLPPTANAVLWLDGREITGHVQDQAMLAGDWPNGQSILGSSGSNIANTNVSLYDLTGAYPAVYFDRSLIRSLSLGFATPISAGSTYYIVCDAIVPPPATYHTLLNTDCAVQPDTLSRRVFFFSDTGVLFGRNGSYLPAAPATGGKRVLITGRCSGATSFVQVDNDARVTGTLDNSVTNSVGPAFGSSWHAASCYTGRLYFVLAYNAEHDDSTIALVRNYLNANFSLY